MIKKGSMVTTKGPGATGRVHEVVVCYKGKNPAHPFYQNYINKYGMAILVKWGDIIMNPISH